MRSIVKTLETILLSSTLLFNSCNVLNRITENQKQAQLREQGYDPYHVNACGPEELQKFLHVLNQCNSTEEISKEILEEGTLGNILRTTLSIFDNEAMDITFPWELKSMMEKHIDREKYVIKKITGDPMKLESYIKNLIQSKSIGIALIKEKNTRMSYHWIYFSDPENDPFVYYWIKNEKGKIIKKRKTEIIEIYHLKEKLPLTNKTAMLSHIYSKKLKYSSDLSFAISERTKNLVDYFGLSLYERYCISHPTQNFFIAKNQSSPPE